ncbi:MAG TPA: FAD-dependent oxidoreductase [Vineibacter sp.]|nr:FAD-dependent oxidoreductase [Vineibacter sp.]
MTRVLIVGSGFAGMWAALGAARARRDLGAAAASIVIDIVAPTSMLCLKPRLYQRDEPVFEVDIAPLLSAVNVGFVAGTVERLDTGGHTAAVKTAAGTLINTPYDALVLATGSHTTPPSAAWRPHVHVLDSAAEALQLRRHVTGLPQRAPSAGRYTAAVIGAGFTGLEIATELGGWMRELAASTGETARTLLLDRSAMAGATLGTAPQAAIAAALGKTGVTFRPTTTVHAISADAGTGDVHVDLADGERIVAATVIWATGMQAHPLGRAAGTVDADGRLPVDAALRVPGHATLFAAGDMARASTTPGRDSPMSCQHAMPMGRIAGHNAVRVLAGVEPIAYAQPMYVTCLDLGGAGGLFTHGWDRTVVWTGADAKSVKQAINGWLIAPPPASQPELALQLADPTPLPAIGPDAVAARWRSLLASRAA